jgi:hypothetical protein
MAIETFEINLFSRAKAAIKNNSFIFHCLPLAAENRLIFGVLCVATENSLIFYTIRKSQDIHAYAKAQDIHVSFRLFVYSIQW